MAILPIGQFEKNFGLIEIWLNLWKNQGKKATKKNSTKDQTFQQQGKIGYIKIPT